MLSRFTWCVIYALEVHAMALLAMGAPSALPAAAALSVGVELLEDRAEPPAATCTADGAYRTIAPSPAGRPRRAARAPRGGEPATAASTVASPDVGEALPVATAPAYPGGLTSSLGTSGEAVDELGGGSGGGTPGDLSAPAHLDGPRWWGCTVDGAPDRTIVRVRALVRADGTAVRVELLDQDGAIPGRVLEGARPCAMRERYVPGLDRDGRPAIRWTRPFRLVVVGVLDVEVAKRQP